MYIIDKLYEEQFALTLKKVNYNYNLSLYKKKKKKKNTELQRN